MKSDSLKKSEEIKKRKREIISAKEREITYDNLKEENTISKLKDNYDSLIKKIKDLKEYNNQIQNDLKNRNLLFQEQENEDNLFLLKEKIMSDDKEDSKDSDFSKINSKSSEEVNGEMILK